MNFFYGFTFFMIAGIQKSYACVTDTLATCTISGDPHFTTFDKTYTGDYSNTHHYQGEGEYWYAISCDENYSPPSGVPFRIKGNQEKCNYGSTSDVSCMTYLEIDLFDYDATPLDTIKLSGSNNVAMVDVDDDTFTAFDTDITIGSVVDDVAFITYSISQTGTNKVTLTLNIAGSETSDCDDLQVSFGAGTTTDNDNNALSYGAGTLIISDAYKGNVCGLCGYFDGIADEEAHIVVTDYITRRLLQTTSVITLDSAGMGSFSTMRDDQDIWERTFQFGDFWAVEEEHDTNMSSIYFPSADCIDMGAQHCTTLWTTESSCGDSCELETGHLFVTFDEWVEGCTFDTCASANADGMQLELFSYEEIVAFGFFDISIGVCEGLCDTLGSCPSVCDPVNGDDCECSEDDHCQSCQSHGHCSQCESGYFKKSDRQHACFPCQAYAGEGCMFCQDQQGCGQCAQGYTLVTDSDCGLRYCR